MNLLMVLWGVITEIDVHCTTAQNMISRSKRQHRHGQQLETPSDVATGSMQNAERQVIKLLVHTTVHALARLAAQVAVR